MFASGTHFNFQLYFFVPPVLFPSILGGVEADGVSQTGT